MFADPVDDGSGSIGIAHDTAERFPDFAQIRRLLVQEIQGCTRVVASSSDRLLDFVSDRCSELTQTSLHDSHAQVRPLLSVTMPLLVGAHDRCHISAGAAIATEFSVGVKHWLAASLHIHRRAVAAHGAIYEVTERFT